MKCESGVQPSKIFFVIAVKIVKWIRNCVKRIDICKNGNCIPAKHLLYSVAMPGKNQGSRKERHNK